MHNRQGRISRLALLGDGPILYEIGAALDASWHVTRTWDGNLDLPPDSDFYLCDFAQDEHRTARLNETQMRRMKQGAVLMCRNLDYGQRELCDRYGLIVDERIGNLEQALDAIAQWCIWDNINDG